MIKWSLDGEAGSGDLTSIPKEHASIGLIKMKACKSTKVAVLQTLEFNKIQYGFNTLWNKNMTNSTYTKLHVQI